ncbi:MAG: hypothetical protein LBD09_06355, partial [Treponema sp.]|nr:hypothetical protein [Treponema sp.]
MSETNRRGRSGAPPAGSPGRYLLSLTPVEIAACAEAGSFLQSAFWGSFKARFGWKALAFRAEWGAAGAGSETAPATAPGFGAAPGSGAPGGAALPLLVLHRPLGPALSFAYIPWGPEL